MSGTSRAEEAENAPPLAPVDTLPTTNIMAIEYPGHVSTQSIPAALHTLGGNQAMARAFKRNGGLLELRFSPENSYLHSIPGEVLDTGNLVLKIVKRRRKRKAAAGRSSDAMDVDGTADGMSTSVAQSSRDGEQKVATQRSGQYSAELVGLVKKTARFRAIADYSYQPDMDQPIPKLLESMVKMDAAALQAFRFGPRTEEYTVFEKLSDVETSAAFEKGKGKARRGGVEENGMLRKSNLHLIPPPVFSRISVPGSYNYKQNSASQIVSATRPDGTEIQRYSYTMKWKALGSEPMRHAGPGPVPSGPTKEVEAEKKNLDPRLLKRLEELFQERPIWTRLALMNQFPAEDQKSLHLTKAYIVSVSYCFVDGPFRGTLVRFGYDPRQDPDSRFYQRVVLRNLGNTTVRGQSAAKSRLEGRQSTGNGVEGAAEMSHIFDGVHLHRNVGNFQLCDITDPLIRHYVYRTDRGVRERCEDPYGWYPYSTFECIRELVKTKFFALLEGKPIPEGELSRILAAYNQQHDGEGEGGWDEDAAVVQMEDVVEEGGRGGGDSAPAPSAQGTQSTSTSTPSQPKKGRGRGKQSGVNTAAEMAARLNYALEHERVIAAATTPPSEMSSSDPAGGAADDEGEGGGEAPVA